MPPSHGALARLVRHFWPLIALVLVALGGCCGVSEYEAQARQTWSELEKAVYDEPTPVDAEETGVSIQLPIVFEKKSKHLHALRPEASSEQDLLEQRVQPPSMTLPGLRFTYEMYYRDSQNRRLPVYCYLAVLAPGSKQRRNATSRIENILKSSYPEASWTSETLEDSGLEVEFLSVAGTQQFVPEGASLSRQAIEAPGRLDLYLVATDYANVLVGWRAPVDIAEDVHFFEAARASVGTLQSEEPEGELPDAPEGQPGNYKQAPGTEVELEPPPGFEPSAAISGFESRDKRASIAVQPQPHPYSAMVRSYSDESLQQFNISVRSREEVTVDGGPATLLLLKNPQQTYWNLVFGDAQGSFVVTATLGDPRNEQQKAALREAILTARRTKSE